tara:strand:+ start:74 stop:433 length:360 start_codon:yes stop_codon:yes gene_type:complete
MAITNKEILEEIEFLKKKMPNGEFALLKKSVEDLHGGQETLRSSIRELKKQLLDPEDGVVVRVNRNSEFRKGLKDCVESFENIEDSVEDIISWKNNVSKALWILFTAVVGLLVHLVMGN